MTRFCMNEPSIAGLQVIERKPIGDERGFLVRMYCQETFAPFIAGKGIRQVNHTLTRKAGVVRGMHYQRPPHAETKIVCCLKGEVLDIAVDLRTGSPTFLQHHAVVLSGDNFRSFLIPEGFAHGFQTLTSDCEMLYFHTADYNAEAEGGLNALDPRLAIEWPLPISERSARDIAHPILTDNFSGVEVS